jgi:hypothetical protein
MNEVVIYKNDNNNIQIDVQFEQDTVWLTQKQMAELFDKDRRTVTEHIKIFLKRRN